MVYKDNDLKALLEELGKKVCNGIAIAVATDEVYDTQYFEDWLYTKVKERESKLVEKTIDSIATYAAMSNRATVKVSDLMNPDSGIVQYAKSINQLQKEI